MNLFEPSERVELSSSPYQGLVLPLNQLGTRAISIPKKLDIIKNMEERRQAFLLILAAAFFGLLLYVLFAGR